MSPMEFYDASAPVDAPAAPPSLLDLGRDGAESDLDVALDRLNDLVEQVSVRDAAEPLPEELRDRLRELTGAADAPLAWESLHRRVRDGLTTWEAFWARPQDEVDGVRLVHAVMAAGRTTLREHLGGDHGPEDARP